MRYGFQMIGVDATGIFTEVVDDEAFRNRGTVAVLVADAVGVGNFPLSHARRLSGKMQRNP